MTACARSRALASLCVAVAALAPALQGCAAPGPAPAIREADDDFRVRLIADADANGSRPVAVDLVQVADPILLASIEEMDAVDWFGARAELVQGHGKSLAITSWEVVPGQRLALATLPPGLARPVASLIYARYGSLGVHRVRVSPDQPVTIHLHRADFTADPAAGR